MLVLVKDLEEKGIEPVVFRYLTLTAHYRDKLNFSWESLQGAHNALNNLREKIRGWNEEIGLSEQSNLGDNLFWQRFFESVNNDLNLPQAVAVLWEMVNSDTTTPGRSKVLLEMDKILGLNLDQYLGKTIEIPEGVQKLIGRREEARKTGNFKESDKLRHEIKKLGFEILDTESGPKIKKTNAS